MHFMTKRARIIAFYLPQFHPIPENDEWWGKGFTDWTNVGNAKPLFKGHYQPRVPADLGYYDLRMPEVREAQAKMACEAGIEGFCYWHYWFGNGKRLLDRPFNEVLNSGKPDFPFCLAWANHPWMSTTWKNNKTKSLKSVLINQNYSDDDYIDHFNNVLPAFLDTRYIRVNNKPIFVVFDPLALPNPTEFINTWNVLAKRNGLDGIHFIGITQNIMFRDSGKRNSGKYIIPNSNSSELVYNRILNNGFNAVNSRGYNRAEFMIDGLWKKTLKSLTNKYIKHNLLSIYNHSEINKFIFTKEDSWENVYPTIIPNWDRSPRAGKKADIYINSNPEVFKKHLNECLDIISKKKPDNKIIFLQSWNEWAEGNYVEPDLLYGNGYLSVLKNSLL